MPLCKICQNPNAAGYGTKRLGPCDTWPGNASNVGWGPEAGVCNEPMCKPIPADALSNHPVIGYAAPFFETEGAGHAFGYVAGTHASAHGNGVTHIGNGPLGTCIAGGIGEQKPEPAGSATHCIAIGRGAQATIDYQFCLRVELGINQGEYTTLATILTPQEHATISEVLRRMVHCSPATT